MEGQVRRRCLDRFVAHFDCGCKSASPHIFLAQRHCGENRVRAGRYQELGQTHSHALFGHAIQPLPGLKRLVLPSLGRKEIDERIRKRQCALWVSLGEIAIGQGIVQLNQIISLIPFDGAQINDLEHFHKMLQGIVNATQGLVALTHGKVAAQCVLRMVYCLFEFFNRGLEAESLLEEQAEIEMGCRSVHTGIDHLGLCLDTGHLNAYGDGQIQGWVETLGPLTREVHLHDNHGDHDNHLGMGKGTINFDILFKSIKQMPNKPIVTIEPHEQEDFIASLDFLEQADFLSLLI